MEQWAIIAVIVVAGLMVVSLLQTILGTLIRYVLFVGMAAAIMKWHNPSLEGFEFLTDLDVLQDLAFIGGLGFAATLIVMTAFFRKSRVRVVLYPLIGFGMTFAAWSVWPHIVEMFAG